MDVNLGIGIGSIKFGMTEDELVSILGEPDEIGEFFNVEGMDDRYKEYNYFDLNLSFNFDSSDNFRLGNFDITGSGHNLFDQDIYGLNIKWTEKYLQDNIDSKPEYENTTWGKPELHELLSVSSFGLALAFMSNSLYCITCSCLFADDNNRVLWPK
jgi:hypothetical protein